jgi:toxin ParE1/3/4
VIIRFVEEAQREFMDGISYYERAVPGLGGRFKDALGRTIRWIADHPDVPRLRSGGYRRVNLWGFPYYVAYVVRGNLLWVLAVAHGSRKPLYWISRRNEIA